MKLSLLGFIILLPWQLAFANCSLTDFRWECDMRATKHQEASSRSLVYCGNLPMYVTPEQYEILVHYQRSDMNMVLMVNGEYIVAPCIPAGRYGAT